MYVMNRHFNNRAVSQIIAALLLIAIAVAAAILLYVFSIGLLGSLGSGGGQQTKEQVIMEAYSFSGITSVTLTLRNVGPSAVNLATADYFVNGIQETPTSTCGSASTLLPQASCAVAIPTTTASLVSGASYPLKIVTPDGGVFSYSVIAGGSS
jgi:flagellin-like protein